MATYLHGTRRTDWQPHEGACLVEADRRGQGELVAEEYAGNGVVLTVEIDTAALVVVEVEVNMADRDEGIYPGDRAAERAALLADGVDAITYYDESPAGRQHRCLRLISERAVLAARVTEE